MSVKKAFADHYRYTKRDVDGLLESGRRAAAKWFVTTEKDVVRLGSVAGAFGESLKTADLKIEFDDEQSVAAWLKKRLAETHMAKGHRKAVEKEQPI